MTKPKNISLQKPNKKKPTKEDLQRFVVSDDQSESIEIPKKRLKKLKRNQSSDQDFLPEGSDDDSIIDSKYLADDPEAEQYSRFRMQNDDDIEQENKKMEQKKKSKKLKGNQEIDKFIKNKVGQDKQLKAKKVQAPAIQTNIADFFKRQKEKKQAQRQPTSVMSEESDSGINDQSLSDGEIMMRRMQAQQKIYDLQGNMTNMSENQLIERAKRLSLQSAKKQNTKIQEDDLVDLNDFQFDNLNPINRKAPVSKPKPQEEKKKHVEKMEIQKPKKQEKPINQSKHNAKKPEPKSANKKSAKKQNQRNDGPLGDEVIAFTGEFEPYSKDELIELCQKLGAKTPATFAKGTTILLQGAYVMNQWKQKTNQDITTTSKSLQAKQKGIRIVPNNDLDDFFVEKTGKTLEEHFKKDVPKLNSFLGKQAPKVQRQTEKMEIEIDEKNFAQKHQNDPTFGMMWTQKYKPKNLDQVIGQNTQIKQLRQWLLDWQDVVLRGNKKDAIPARGFLPSGTVNSRAALLSGDPGLGKTTTARLLAKELGYNVIEFNASDIRNKKGVALLESNSMGIHETSGLVKNLMIMDEVDGMSKGDRGGITQIINMIKQTTVPIICICNDRQSQKIRSLAGHCLDIRFHKPHKQMIVKRLKDVIENEGGKASDLFLARLVETFQNDMRQILNYLELAYKTKAAQLLEVKDAAELNKFTKDSAVSLTNFEATRKLLTRFHGSGMPLRERMDCFFIDSDFVPIMVHENYLSSVKKGKMNRKEFHKLVKANDAFVLADQIDTRIRKEQDWGLMPAFGFMSSVYPAEMVAENIGYPSFPSWLGKFSSQRKHKRLLKELRQAIHCELPSTFKGVRYGLAEIFYQEINYLLKHDKVQETLDLMETYNLSPAIMNEVLLEVQYNPQKNALLPDVTSSTKAKLTKAFNRRHEEARMKGKAKKIAVPAAEHLKYNEVLEEMSDDNVAADDQEENNQNQNSQLEEQNQKKDKKKAPKGGNKKK